jgi:hypothetical protein
MRNEFTEPRDWHGLLLYNNVTKVSKMRTAPSGDLSVIEICFIMLAVFRSKALFQAAQHTKTVPLIETPFSRFRKLASNNTWLSPFLLGERVSSALTSTSNDSESWPKSDKEHRFQPGKLAQRTGNDEAREKQTLCLGPSRRLSNCGAGWYIPDLGHRLQSLGHCSWDTYLVAGATRPICSTEASKT